MALGIEIPLSALSNLNRRTIRAEINPMDKSTIVSIYPREIKENNKWTIQPNKFEIPAGTYEKPALLVVGSSSWWRDVDPDQPLLEIPQSSITVADSIVRDYCNGLVGCDMAERMPGLFFIPGEIDLRKLLGEYKPLLDKAKTKQRNWYETLVKIADIYWAQYNGNPISISEDMRIAAKDLGFDREWVRNVQAIEMIRCVACGNMRNPAYPICMHCRTVVDKSAYDKLGLKPAE